MTDRAAPLVDPTNAEQFRAWNGDQGAYWADRAERFDEGVAAYREQFFAAAAIEPTARVLDIGCGSGQTARDAARRASAGRVLGVDLSSRMIELARELAERENLTNISFEQTDAAVHSFPDNGFDLAISRHGAMFFGDASAAFRNIARALRPGGRLVLLAWQPLRKQEWLNAFRTALAAGRELPTPSPQEPGPFSLSEPDQVRKLLSSIGLTDVTLHGLSEAMYFGRDVDDASSFVIGQFGAMIDPLDSDTKARALEDLRASMINHLADEGVRYRSAAWLIQARRD